MNGPFLKNVKQDFLKDFEDDTGLYNLIIAIMLWIVIFLIGMFAGDLKNSSIIIWWISALPIAFGLYYGSRYAILHIIKKRKSKFKRAKNFVINEIDNLNSNG